MKTYRVLLLALIVSAVLAVTVEAGNRHGGGGSQVASAPARSSASAYRSGPRFHSSGGRMIAPSQRFSSIGRRPGPTGFNQRYVNSGASLRQRRVTPGEFNRRSSVARSGNNLGNRGGSIGNGNRHRGGGENHVFARRSANWHRDWDRRHDHWWNGHRCRFVNGYWFIFDLGFSPWYYGYPYPYYYADNYYYDPSGYDSGAYEQTDPNYSDGKGTYDSSNQNGDSSVAAAQERLSKQGYYRGAIDGVFGPETRRAITRFQSEHNLRATGYLTSDTLQALGLRQGPDYQSNYQGN